MGKISKEQNWRMQGAIWALDFAKNNGLEELQKDLRKRGFFEAHLTTPQKELDNFIANVADNMYMVSLATVCTALNDEFGFGKQRLQKFKQRFDKVTEDVFDFDWAGEHYITLEDYAKDLNRKFDLGVDEERVAKCQYSTQTEIENRGKCRLKDVIDYLRECNFEDAAKHLERLVD